MISTNDFFPGLTIILEEQVHQVIESQHVKPGKGPAFVRAKLRNLVTGAVFAKTFRAAEKLPRAIVERREMQLLYRSGDELVFMDQQTYEQLSLDKAQVGDAVQWLVDGATAAVVVHEGLVLRVELPPSVVLEITESDPGLKGDTATGGTKPATLETGATVQVPLFVSKGDRIKVDTRTGQYVERA